MNYHKLQLADTRRVPWKRASKHVRGVLVTLHTYCADVENGGRIHGASRLSDQDWKDLADVSREDVDALVTAGLAEWEGQGLIVHLYDVRGEEMLRIKCAQGHHGIEGGRKTKNPKGTLRVRHRVSGENNPKGSPHTNHSIRMGEGEVSSKDSPPPGRLGFDTPTTGGGAKTEAKQTPVAPPPMNLRALMDRRS